MFCVWRCRSWGQVGFKGFQVQVASLWSCGAMGGSRTSFEEQGGRNWSDWTCFICFISFDSYVVSCCLLWGIPFLQLKECARHTDDALGDAWSCTSAFVCIGVFNRRLSVFTIFMLLSVLNTVCFTVCKFFLPLCLVFSFVLVWFVLCGVLEVGEYRFPSGRVPVLNKCWKAGTGVLIAKRSQRKSIFPKEQSNQEMVCIPI